MIQGQRNLTHERCFEMVSSLTVEIIFHQYLVSGFPVNIFKGIVHTKIEKTLFIHTNVCQEHKRTQNIF